MDFSRGSRRARHVAANAAAAAAASSGSPSHPTSNPEQQQQQPSQQHAVGHDASLDEPRRRIRVHRHTPDTHRTPDQVEGGEDVAPPINPFRLHRITHANPRLSMPEVSDDSDSEPDLSVLAMARHGGAGPQLQMPVETYEDETMSQEEYEAEDTSVEEQVEEDEHAEDEEEEDEQEEVEHELIQLVDPASLGLKEISNLGKFTVSSHKPGNGVEELRSDDLRMYWQSDGPQPHKLTVYFVKRVGIRDIRFYVDYHEDESYTPTKIVFKSGISENNLIEFATMNLDNPVGWQQVPIAGAGGDPDGNTLVSYVLQMQILENHQNGKDTHLRGIKVYAFDAEAAHEAARLDDNDTLEGGMMELAPGEAGRSRQYSDIAKALAATKIDPSEWGFAIPDFMREPELR